MSQPINLPPGYGSDSPSFRKRNPHLFPQFTPAAPSKGDVMEGDLHDEFETWLIANGWLYRHDRMDKPTTGQVGWPDFSLFMPGRLACFIEFKRPGAKTTVAQNGKLAHARKFGFAAEVCDNVPAAQNVVLAVLRGEYAAPVA